MRGAHSYFMGSGDIRLHYRCWEVPTARAAIIVCHGLGEHSGRYEDLAQDFARAGLNTYALDHRGHGRSDGRKGHVRRFVRYIHDLEKFRRRVFGAVGTELPLIFLGHSLGGLILIRYLQEYPAVPARGAVLSAPLLGLATEAPQWKARLARFLYYTIPALPMSTGLNPEYLSHDAQVVEAYKRDPLVHDRITPRLYGEIEKEIELAFGKVSQLRLPVLMLVPSADRLVRPDLMQRLAADLKKTSRLQVRTLAGLYHEVLNETTRSRVVADVLGWIERRIPVYSQPEKASGPAD
ncbi:MAG: alpha/beta hydrolase [Gemmatimonadetes bacterium]|nr:alpha/beta hydrolase [Gemmatimonadota bacterium]NIT64976.1 alpha/beta hydrolase [Gammaproteobacteria bacterium]NIU53831.1 alpha/beta fold hydrolase [Gemmatimonadota bacterium]NIV21100.1 alpha/beta fold hydrolase [Gammaproteobacteria bacterium]NIW38704.1 alpha/beta fold hydrolase [Gemmatimonadota bacterium]